MCHLNVLVNMITRIVTKNMSDTMASIIFDECGFRSIGGSVYRSTLVEKFDCSKIVIPVPTLKKCLVAVIYVICSTKRCIITVSIVSVYFLFPFRPLVIVTQLRKKMKNKTQRYIAKFLHKNNSLYKISLRVENVEAVNCKIITCS